MDCRRDGVGVAFESSESKLAPLMSGKSCVNVGCAGESLCGVWAWVSSSLVLSSWFGGVEFSAWRPESLLGSLAEVWGVFADLLCWIPLRRE